MQDAYKICDIRWNLSSGDETEDTSYFKIVVFWVITP
jgi:hypothetical protein